MSYLNAEEVLPEELIKTIQQYVNGKAIYIPSPEKKAWGSTTDTKGYLKERNLKIYREYEDGLSIIDIADRYFLSEKSIQRIIRDIRNQCRATA